MKVLVCGGRDFADVMWLGLALDTLHQQRPITLVIDGGATGADTLAYEWAAERGILAATFQADWGKHGRAAGPIRNQQMLDEGKPDLVVAFPGGRGTEDMINRARTAKIEVLEPVRP